MSAAAGDCWHCGSPLPISGVVRASIGGQMRAMCCQGCRAAATWIEQLGLGDYYRLRTLPAQKPESLDEGRDAWSREEIARHVVRDLRGGRCETLLLLDGVRCAACVWLIERALKGLPGVHTVQVNAAACRGRVVWDGTATSLPQILEVLSRAGYRALPLDAQALDDVRRDEAHVALKRLLVAGFGSMQAMMYAAILYLGGIDPLDVATREFFRWLTFLVATPVLFYAAQPFFAGALRSLRAGRLSMDVPVALAMGLVYAASVLEALRGGEEVYFDSVSMFVFFLLAGRYVEMRARHRAGDLTDALIRLTPPFAQRQRGDGTLERVGIHELDRGDRVYVAEGSVVPVDGSLLDERCRVDESLLSGESIPLPRRRGDMLLAGSVLIEGPARLRVERTGAETMLAGIAALVTRAQTERPRLARAGERAAARFVARVLSLTVLTAIIWSFVEPSHAFTASLAVLVVSCPCALALAVPAAITRAVAALARRGILVAKPDAIESLDQATHVVFDKTGTLTEPDLALGDVETWRGYSRQAALELAARLACTSRHPAARAITTAVGSDIVACDATSQAGLGISAQIGSRHLRLGRPDFALAGKPLPLGCESTVMLADDDGVIATFHLSERLRPGALATVAALRAQGLEVLLASGDAPDKVEAVARQLGIAQWRARQLPADKLAWLTQLRANGARVIVVGDGSNDAPVLAGADAAVSFAQGTELAQAASDIVLTGEKLEVLVTARTVSRQALAILRQNQRWALCYNLSAVPLAALGWVPPWLAAIGMSLSSLVVIMNTLRIGRDDTARRDTAVAPIIRGVEAA